MYRAGLKQSRSSGSESLGPLRRANHARRALARKPCRRNVRTSAEAGSVLCEVPRDGPKHPVFGERCRFSSGAKEKKQEAVGGNKARKLDTASGVREARTSWRPCCALGWHRAPHFISPPIPWLSSGFSCAQGTSVPAKTESRVQGGSDQLALLPWS